MNRLNFTHFGRVTATLIFTVFAVARTAAAADTITFSLPTITLSESNSVQSGAFLASISDNGTDTITAFTVDVTTSGPVTLRQANDLTQLNNPAGGPLTYIFSTNSNDDPTFHGEGTSFSLNNQNWFLNDAATDSGTVLTNGTPLGLLWIEYSVPAGFVGTVPLDITSFAQSPAFGAVWGDSNYNANFPTIVDGAIIVTPEPSALVLLLLGAAGWFAFRLKRRA
jgi:hypothetical protein